ncbi:hypothetical protein ACFLPY_001775 [Salmonella enterica]
MSNIDKRETELLIENGVLVADTLRHLADNEIDSDCFAICQTNENGTEIECELAITDYARQAAGTVEDLVKTLEAAEKRIAEQSAIVAAAEKLVRCKGRYHSEQNYRALAALFGVNTPDLPPMDGESRTVMMPEPFKMAKSSSGLMYYYADEVDKALAAAGIKVKGE